MIVDSIEGLRETSLFMRMHEAYPDHEVYVKLEGLNTAGSIKLKAAVALIDDLEKDGRLRPGGGVVESSSGSLGVALAAVCARRGYSLTIVTDPNANDATVAHMKALGARVEVVNERDESGGYLGTRLARIQQLQSLKNGPVWTNQYSNSANSNAHSTLTYPAIVEELGDPDLIFVGAGTTGTLMGVIQGVSARRVHTEVYAIDSVGSVTFGILQPQSYRVVARANGDNVLVAEDGDDVSAQEIHSASGWILKPATGMGSAGVRYLSSSAEVVDALAASEADGYCVEEFVTGEEFSVEGITVDGAVRVYGVTTKAKNTGFVEIGHRFPAHHPQLPGDEEISRQLQRCVDFLAIEWGHLHVEFWVSDDGCIVWGEFHVRQAGGLIAPDMIEAARPGLRVYDELIDSLSGRPLPALPQRTTHAAVDFIESEPGRVVMAGVSSSAPPASSVHWEYGVGEYAPAVNGLRANIAVIFAGADTADDAEQIVQSARQACTFVVDSVEDES